MKNESTAEKATQRQDFFLAVGPPKTGTTWLYAQLQKHTDIFLTSDKEVRYFWSKKDLGDASLWKRLTNQHWHYREKRGYFRRKLVQYVIRLLHGNTNTDQIRWDFKYLFGKQSDDWYLSLFRADRLSGDISPKYSELGEESIAEIHQLLPQAKILISLRDPVERDWSRAKMNLLKKRGRSSHTQVGKGDFMAHFSQGGQHQANDYAALVKRWRKFYGENVFVFFFEQISEDPVGLLNEICDFLGCTRLEGINATEKVNEGLAEGLPAYYRDALFDLNRCYLEEMVDFFPEHYPHDWVERYSQ